MDKDCKKHEDKYEHIYIISIHKFDLALYSHSHTQRQRAATSHTQRQPIFIRLYTKTPRSVKDRAAVCVAVKSQ